jgi:hypothetical protein
VKKLLAKLAQRLAPRTVTNLRSLSVLDEEFNEGPERFLNYEREIAGLRREIDELRRDNRRVTELYDMVFEWVKAGSAARGVAPHADGSATVARVAEVIAEERSLSTESSLSTENGQAGAEAGL